MMKLNIQLFGEKVITTTLVDLKYDDQTGAKENKSAVGIKAYFKAASSSTWFNKKNIYFYCKIVHPNGTEDDMEPLNWDNTTKARTVQCSLSEGGKVDKDFYFYFVPHEPDGSLKVRCYWTINTGTSGLGNITKSQTEVTQVMASIPRASFPTVSSSSVAMGSSVTIYTNRASTSFTHTIRYAFGNTSGTIATGVGASTSWTPALTLAQQIPGGTSGSGTIYCDTYSNGNLIGTNSVGITLTVPASVKPTISIGTPSEANATMISLNWGVFVQGKSQLSIPITASGSQGSWITGTTTTVNGASYSGTSITTEIIKASGFVAISSTTTDSRSRTASASKTATFVAYSNPQITTATAVRCLSDGTEDDEGTYVKYSFAGSISAVSNHNSHLFRIGYREKGVGSYTYIDVNTTDYSINYANYLLNLSLDTSKSYDIRFEANDYFTSTAIERVIDTGFDLMNFNANGKAMAIGKVSEAGANEELFEVGMDTKVEGNINTQNGNIGINNTYPGLYMNNNIVLRISDGLYVGGYGSYIVLRPNGLWDPTGQTVIYTDGHMVVNGDIWTPKGRVVSTIFVDGERTSNDTPASWRSYTNSMNSGREYRFKDGGYIGLSSDWTGLETIKTYVDTSGGPMHQIAYNNKGLYYRVGKTDDSSWENWVGLNHTKEVTFNGQWLVASRASGAGVRLMIPFYNPLKKTPTLYYYSANYFNGSSWVTINQGEISISDWLETFVVLYFSNIGSTPNDNVLVNLYGSITI